MLTCNVTAISPRSAKSSTATDSSNAPDDFAAAVIEGLSRPQKTLPCRFFYDDRGSALFEEITRLPEYYPTRVETGILAAHAEEMVDGARDGGVLIEFGSGSSRKTELLLKAATGLSSYVPIDVSADALRLARRRLATRFPDLDVRPVIGDFTKPITLPADIDRGGRIGFFPGSTIGNFTPSEAAALLGRFRAGLAPGCRLIVGVDLKKDARTLVRAYNDGAGVTAAFNLNLLERINREIESVFETSAFQHSAVYNPVQGRIEMHLVSTRDVDIRLRGSRFSFRAGETIHTENSYKYTVEDFQDVSRAAGWIGGRIWTDADALFSVHELISPTGS